MAFKRLPMLIVVLILSLTACTRQASEPVQVVAEASSGSMTMLPSVTPTSPSGIAVMTSTPFVAPSATATATATATLLLAPTEMETATETLVVPSSTAVVTATDAPEIVMFTATPIITATPTTERVINPAQAETSTPVIVATQPILTPALPSGNQSAISTPTPRATIVLEPTPTDAFITPEDTGAGAEIPEECIYIVRAGDTVYRIALNHDTTVNAIAVANPGLNPNIILPGDEIIIPNCEANLTPTAISTFSADSSGSTSNVPLGGEDQGIIEGVQNIHVVQAGETLGGIAQRYGVTVNAIVQANSLSDPNRLSIGQQLVIPPSGN